MKSLYYLLVLAGLSVGPAHAQHARLGFRLGGNLATGNFTRPTAPDGVTLDYSTGYVAGMQVGVGASFDWGHWAFQPTLLFTQKGLTQDAKLSASDGPYSYQEHDELSSRINYLELPLNLVYALGRDGQGVQLFAGPYVAVGLGGRTRTSSVTEASYQGFTRREETNEDVPMTFGDTFEDQSNNPSATGSDSRARRFDAGLNLGVGYRRGPVQVQLGYGLGLLNVQPDYPTSYQLPNTTGYLRTVQLAATFYLPASSR